MPADWPHQSRALSLVSGAIETGERRICLTIPTGGGKSKVGTNLIEFYAGQRWPGLVLTNRKLLVDQLSGVLTAAGIHHGIRAAGYRDERELLVQISSAQTEIARCFRRKDQRKWQLHPARIVLVDEAHLQATGESLKLLEEYAAAGAAVVGLTATPLDLGHFYTHLIQCGTVSELRACGALVPAIHYGCDEPDLKHVGRVAVGEELSENQNVKAIMRPGVFGRVWDNWRRLNPDGLPTLGFGPGVAESLWFAEQFRSKGVRAAHIDGEDCWIDEEWYRNSREVRDQLLQESKSGRIKVVWNRFVLREGVDMPWVRVGILATVFGGLGSYLQSGGRLLRSSQSADLAPRPAKDHCLVLDHGGNYLRHGSLNADRSWSLSCTNGLLARTRSDALREGGCQQCGQDPVPPVRPNQRWQCGECGFWNGPEPFPCPQCKRVLTGRNCPCGFVCRRRSRFVVQADGRLTEQAGAFYQPKKRARKPDTADVWKKVYYRAFRSKRGMTFRQAEGLFCHENHYWPPRDLPLMPRHGADWYLLVRDVDRGRLR